MNWLHFSLGSYFYNKEEFMIDGFILILTGFPFLFLSLIGGCFGRPFYPLPSKTVNQSKQLLQTFRPYNIAHRGSNGELPEETSAAYMVSF